MHNGALFDLAVTLDLFSDATMLFIPDTCPIIKIFCRCECIRVDFKLQVPKYVIV